MGMDLIIATCYQQHPERSIAELEVMAMAMDDKQAVELWEEVQQISWDFTYESAAECASSVRTELVQILQTMFQQRSIVIDETPQGQTVLIGGGDSWGDTPSGFDDVALLNAWGEW